MMNWKEYGNSFYILIWGTNLVLPFGIEEYKELGIFVFLPGFKMGIFHIGSKSAVHYNTYAMGYMEQSLWSL